METTTTKKNIVAPTPAVEVVITNFDIDKLAKKFAKMMPAILDKMVQREYSKKL